MRTPDICRAPAPALSDPQIAGVLHSFYNSRIRIAAVALVKGVSPAVRSQATQTSGQNAAARDQLLKLPIQPVGSQVSAGVDRLSEAEIASLGRESHTSFDQAYLAKQVDDHKHFLQMIDQVLLPSARDVKLRTHVTVMRPQVDADLREATNLQQATASRGGRATGGSPTRTPVLPPGRVPPQGGPRVPVLPPDGFPQRHK